jgi:hypothetical protein
MVTPGPSSEPPSSLPMCTSTIQPNNALADADIEGVDEDNELDDELWEDEEDEAGDVLLAARETASGSVMDIEINDGVDVSVPQLQDFLSDTPALSPLFNVEAGSTAARKATPVESSAPRVFEVPDIQF